jgi:hypothetical protein
VPACAQAQAGYVHAEKDNVMPYSLD